MERVRAIAGIVLLVIGATLWVVPIGMAQPAVDVPALRGLAVEGAPPLSLYTLPIPFSASWSSDSGLPVNVSVYRCGTSLSSCSGASSEPGHLVASGAGSTGSLSWNGPKGDYFLIVPSASATLHPEIGSTIAGGAAGLLAIALGAVLLLMANFRRPGKPLAGPKDAPAPASTATKGS